MGRDVPGVAPATGATADATPRYTIGPGRRHRYGITDRYSGHMSVQTDSLAAAEQWAERMNAIDAHYEAQAAKHAVDRGKPTP